MRSLAFFASLPALLARDKGDTMSQVTWCVSLLILVSVLAILAARYVSPELVDSVGLPRWLR